MTEADERSAHDRERQRAPRQLARGSLEPPRARTRERQRWGWGPGASNESGAPRAGKQCWQALRAWLTLALVGCMIACGTPQRGDGPGDYAERLTSERAAKDAAFRERDSPIPPEKQSSFLPLAYYPIDPAYRVPASLKLAETRTPVDMPTSSGQMRKMELVGTLEFTLKDTPLTLGAFVEAGQPPLRLFVPFADQTSGTETYNAGRYLDLDRTSTGIYVIDFNLAYHPYCYYNPTWECPYPPPSNRLAVPIRAGERMKP